MEIRFVTSLFLHPVSLATPPLPGKLSFFHTLRVSSKLCKLLNSGPQALLQFSTVWHFRYFIVFLCFLLKIVQCLSDIDLFVEEIQTIEIRGRAPLFLAGWPQIILYLRLILTRLVHTLVDCIQYLRFSRFIFYPKIAPNIMNSSAVF